MSRFCVIAIAIFVATAPAHAYAADVRPTIFFAQGQPPGVLGKAIEESVAWFAEEITQARILERGEGQADYAFPSLTVSVSRNRSDMELVAVFRTRGTRATETLTSACRKCDVDAVWAMFVDIVDQALFNERSGAYLPLVLENCTQDDRFVNRVNGTIQPRNGIGIEQPVVMYRVAEIDLGSRFQIVDFLDVSLRVVEPSSGNTTAVFRLDGRADDCVDFRRHDCRGRPQRPLAVVPKLNPENSQRLNGNVIRGSG